VGALFQKFWFRVSILTITCAGLIFLTVSLWIPPVFNALAPGLLERAGVTQAALILTRFDFNRSELSVKRLRTGDILIEDASLQLDYNFSDIRRGRVNRLTIRHPEIEIDWSKWHGREADAEAKQGTRPTSGLPERPPLEEFFLKDAVLRLKGLDRSRVLDAEASVFWAEKLAAEVTLGGQGLQFDGKLESSWPELSGRASARASISELSEWIEIGLKSNGSTMPENFQLETAPVQLEGTLDFKEAGIERWNARIETENISLFTGTGSATSGRVQVVAEMLPAKPQSLNLSAIVSQGNFRASGVSLASEYLELGVFGTLPERLGGVIAIRGGQLSWSEGAGLLAGLEGSVRFDSLMPPATEGESTLQFDSIEQGAFTAESGTIRLSYQEAGNGENLKMELMTRALGGGVRILVKGRLQSPVALDIRVYLESVDLEQVAALFSQFDGRLEGRASGQLALGLEDGRLVLQPGSLQLLPNTKGVFEYLRQGWLSQDPDLDPELFVQGRDIVAIMKDPLGAPVITELAMRHLTMSGFKLDVLGAAAGNQQIVARIEGQGEVKGIVVPVVLDVPIRGDVKETIDAVLELNSKM